jgi:hypothetical protein
MQTQYFSRDDTQEHAEPRSAVEASVGPHAGEHPMTVFAADGLFSHPDTDHLDTRPGPPPEQRSYTNLFREPTDAAENTTSAA